MATAPPATARRAPHRHATVQARRRHRDHSASRSRAEVESNHRPDRRAHQLFRGPRSTAMPHLKGGRMRGWSSQREAPDRHTGRADVRGILFCRLRGGPVVRRVRATGHVARHHRKLNAALVSACKDCVQKDFPARVELVSSTPEALAAYVKTELRAVVEVVEGARIRTSRDLDEPEQPARREPPCSAAEWYSSICKTMASVPGIVSAPRFKT